ncbi:MAG: lytic transglycosylase domain-containing protein [Desulfovibrio sp.]|nr:lytic transglycosylase domain-containing protein [Desulfovibrio sp.]
MSLAALCLFACCALARPGDRPLNETAAWKDGLVRLNEYRLGGSPPPPLHVGLAPQPLSTRSGSMFSPATARLYGPRPDWRNIIRDASLRHGLDENLLTAVMQVESNFNRYAVSRKGALGAMQIMPETGRLLGLRDFFDPVANTDAGARYLAEMLRTFKRLDLSLSAYNAGPGAVRQYGGQIPPYRETRDYVFQVLAAYKRLKTQRVK